MKKITSILGSVLLASVTLVPVATVLAEESTSTVGTTTVATSTVATTSKPIKVERRDGRGYMPPAFSSSSLNRPADWKDLKKASSTATSTVKHEDKNKKDEKKNNRYGDKFKIDVASTTQKLLDIANKLGALGTEIKAIVAGQASSSDVVAAAINKEEVRGGFAKFLFGADLKNLGAVISQVSVMQARINQLDNKISKMASSTDKTALIANVQTLKDQVATLEKYVKDNINSFSLFGWLTKKSK